ncbi:probable 39S ribosomal protein L24, mitochondrial [Lutzomyia longipalpis]|uniref:probable 39S ribosomal protein L24, mitochondrial n=1 Tax=Lutzomyia longipalpis TaxID=7200 RepID=UPI00248433D7|nr:probable 39S ribosomal protein L24, mitochondrial [Lutzomyia longipalpis]
MRLTSQLLRKVHDLSIKYSNFPESYVKRAMEQVYWKTPNEPNYQQKVIEKRRFRFTTNRPWTGQFRQQNLPRTSRKKVFIEPIAEWSFFRGDRVEVLVGRDKGKQGIVKQLIPERNWVLVEGLNCHMRKVGGEGEYPGIYIKSEAPLLVTNQVKLVDPADLQATEIEWRYTEEGDKVRVSTRTGRIVPIPKEHEETHDYKSRGTYMEKDKDTPAKVVEEITFKPSLQTFEMEIMKEMGIQEERIPKKTYWY